MGLDALRAAAELEARLRELGTPERAEAERRYLKSELEHFGATVWQIRREAKSFARAHADLSHDELIALVEALWSRPVHERRMAAVFLLEASPELVEPDDLPLLERLVRESETWALVDGLAGDVIGELLVRHPRAAKELDRWAEDDDSVRVAGASRGASLGRDDAGGGQVPRARAAGRSHERVRGSTPLVRREPSWDNADSIVTICSTSRARGG